MDKSSYSITRQVSFSVLFIVLIMISNLRFSSMYVYYSLDREGFIEQLCENKDKPELNCNGKCMLMQMLNAQAEDDEPMPVIGWEEVLVFFIDMPAYNLPVGKEENKGRSAAAGGRRRVGGKGKRPQ